MISPGKWKRLFIFNISWLVKIDNLSLWHVLLVISARLTLRKSLIYIYIYKASMYITAAFMTTGSFIVFSAGENNNPRVRIRSVGDSRVSFFLLYLLFPLFYFFCRCSHNCTRTHLLAYSIGKPFCWFFIYPAPKNISFHVLKRFSIAFTFHRIQHLFAFVRCRRFPFFVRSFVENWFVCYIFCLFYFNFCFWVIKMGVSFIFKIAALLSFPFNLFYLALNK